MKTIIGDLLDIRAGTILHQVNCVGVVGGLAGALHAKWPSAFDAYFKCCRANGAFALGGFTLSEAAPGLFIGHVFGQLNGGRNTDMAAVIEALGDAMQVVSGPVYAPFKMGCGIGGGDWRGYEAALEACFPDITIVQRAEDSE